MHFADNSITLILSRKATNTVANAGIIALFNAERKELVPFDHNNCSFSITRFTAKP